MTKAKQNGNAVKKLLLGLAIFMLVLILCPMAVVQAEEQIVEVGIPVEEHPELFGTRSMPTHGEGKIVVFLIQFPDYMNDNPKATQEYYNKLYFSGGWEKSTQGKETVASFYKEQSYGKLNLSGQVFDWYTAKHERSYYDDRKAELVMEAAEYYQAQGVDFSQFDGDGDGTIDAIVFHFAGETTTERYTPWYPGVAYGVSNYFGIIDNLKFTTIVQVDERVGAHDMHLIRTIRHELMHTLDMPDLYGESYFGLKPAVDLMVGNHDFINPYFKILLGWIDTVKVITENSHNVQLELYNNDTADDVAIVTDRFNGFFDEFFIIAYNDYLHTSGVIWHIDARLNEEKTTFLYCNLHYDPRPDRDNPHRTEHLSPYLFVEELSADPKYNLIFSNMGGRNLTAFGPDSMLAPNHLPSSDTHDGRYTGIQIENFEEHNEEYLTFDVSFVADHVAPLITTQESDLEFKETINLQFNEYIYAGEMWDDIQITDMEGNPLDASILLTHYPRNKIEITFNDDLYKRGYKLIFPENSVQDSSGNGLAATTLTASIENYLFAISEKQLPGTGAYLRDNSKAYFFPKEDSILVITALWENHEYCKKIEFMRLDYNGNVLSQTIVDNPLSNTTIVNIAETGDDRYIFMCCDKGMPCLFFCFDAEAKLKWINEDYRDFYDMDGYFDSSFIKKTDGIMIRPAAGLFVNHFGGNEWVHLSSIDGTITPIDSLNIDREKFLADVGETVLPGFHTSIRQFGETLLRQSRYESSDGMHYTIVEILNPVTYEVEDKIKITGSTEDSFNIREFKANKNGTFLVCYEMDQGCGIILFDIEWNVVKSLDLDYGMNRTIEWLDDGGFCVIELTFSGNHANSHYHVRRYDQCLNLVWETDVIAEFVYYFHSLSGEVMAYRSMWEPKRECYIDYYGQEDAYKNEHVHSLVSGAVASTCLSEGYDNHWRCTECGCWFSYEDKSLLLDAEALILPISGHTEVTIPPVAPTCATLGATEGSKCSICDKIFIAPQDIPKNDDHVYTDWIMTEAPTCGSVGTETSTCNLCGKESSREIPATGEHSYGEWTLSYRPSCAQAGADRARCAVCGHWIYREIPPTGDHRYGRNPIVIEDATCIEAGTATYRCVTCSKTEAREIPATGEHVYGEWAVTKAASCVEAGTEARECSVCGKVETREIPATGEHVYGEWAVTTEASCAAAGVETRTCACGLTETREIAATGEHLFGEWTVSRAATEELEGEETRACTVCGKVETRLTEKLPPAPKNNTPIIVIAIGAGVALGGLTMFLARRKRK
ncbi:MAG: Ig-like domain-containing protein [Clostridia bacterium]|nr:Ig-like domain-containing protein [Clostridia bacterium]